MKRRVMWRALVAFVGVMLAVGLYVLFTGGPPAEQASAATPASSAGSFGFALAAGAVALAATILVSRPRLRMRR